MKINDTMQSVDVDIRVDTDDSKQLQYCSQVM